MSELAFSLLPLTVWHWLILGLILLIIEISLGTYDLLWIAIACGITALFAGIAPQAIAGTKGQLIVFATSSAGLVVLGRTVFRQMRAEIGDHPTLNNRMASTIGQKGHVVTDFSGGIGRVKLGDTVWSAESLEGADLVTGMAVIVEDTEGNMVKVRSV